MQKVNLITFLSIIMIFFQYQIMKSQTDTSKNHPLNFAFNINLAIFLSKNSSDDWKTGLKIAKLMLNKIKKKGEIHNEEINLYYDDALPYGND